MKTELLIQILTDSQSHDTSEWIEMHRLLFKKEYLEKLAKTLITCYFQAVPETLPHPHFNEELTPLLLDAFLLFKPTLKLIEAQDYNSNTVTQKSIAQVLETIDFKHILILMGQRITSATIKDVNGLPLLKQDVLESSFKPYNKHISIALRSWEKHIDRTEDNFWGSIQGKPIEKEAKVRTLICNLIDKHTWWNVFYHYKHELVYEIRVASGHGMRWRIKDKTLIGFLEPFL